MTGLLSVREANQLLLSHFSPVKTTRVPLDKALGRVLSADISAPLDLPPFSNSSMDGFAVRVADITTASAQHPITLEVVADIPAGAHPEIYLRPGQAARIMTGAFVPEGAEAVVPVEDTDALQDAETGPLRNTVAILRPVQAGDYIRPRGQDLQKGQAILAAGHRLRPQDVGMLATAGVTQVPVYATPRLALFSTGDELVSPDESLSPGKIRDANTYSLAALTVKYGGEPLSLGVAKDEINAIKRLLDSAVDNQVDLIISSAGVSVGAYDLVRDVVKEQGRIEFWRVNMRPGKPISFGYYRDIPFIGLPGNPVSTFVCFEVFVHPILARLAGVPGVQRRSVTAILEEDIESDGRESYLRGILQFGEKKNTARLTGHQGSGNLFSLVQANALLVIPSGVKSLPAGSEVESWILDE